MKTEEYIPEEFKLWINFGPHLKIKAYLSSLMFLLQDLGKYYILFAKP